MSQGNYEDIIHLPHYEPRNHPRMSPEKRAAQFAPFSALTGYGDKVEEAARYVDARPELSEEDLKALNENLRLLLISVEEHPRIRIRYFLPDERKEGGACLETVGRVKRTDPYRRILTLEDGTQIPFSDLISLNLTEEEDPDFGGGE